jgi:hypothetical protein
MIRASTFFSFPLWLVCKTRSASSKPLADTLMKRVQLRPPYLVVGDEAEQWGEGDV